MVMSAGALSSRLRRKEATHADHLGGACTFTARSPFPTEARLPAPSQGWVSGSRPLPTRTGSH